MRKNSRNFWVKYNFFCESNNSIDLLFTQCRHIGKKRFFHWVKTQKSIGIHGVHWRISPPRWLGISSEKDNNFFLWETTYLEPSKVDFPGWNNFLKVPFHVASVFYSKRHIYTYFTRKKKNTLLTHRRLFTDKVKTYQKYQMFVNLKKTEKKT